MLTLVTRGIPVTLVTRATLVPLVPLETLAFHLCSCHTCTRRELPHALRASRRPAHTECRRARSSELATIRSDPPPRVPPPAAVSPEAHAASLEAAEQWCARRHVELEEDLLGAGIDLQADTSLWDELLAELQLSTVLANRIRRELMARRARLVEAQTGARAVGGGAPLSRLAENRTAKRRSCALM